MTPHISIFLLLLSTSLLWASQSLISPNLTAIATDLHLSPSQRDWLLGGIIPLAFFAVGAPVALLTGTLADRLATNRVRLLVLTTALGHVPSLFAFVVRDFAGLLVLRTLTGAALAGATPINMSLLSDYLGAVTRVIAVACLGVTVTLGVASGTVIATFLSERFGSWRLPLAVVAGPALVVSGLVWMLVDEPPRGKMDSRDAADEINVVTITRSDSDQGFFEQLPSNDNSQLESQAFSQKVRAVFSVRTNVLCIAQGLAGCLPDGIVNTYMVDFFAFDKKLGIRNATILSVVGLLGVLVGMLVGGGIGQALYNRGWKMRLVQLTALAVASTALPFATIINIETTRVALFGGLAFVGGFLLGCSDPNIKVMVVNVNNHATRGTAFAFLTVATDLGKGLGPFGISVMIALLGRQAAFSVAMLMYIVCGMIIFFMSFSFEEDEEKARHYEAVRATELPQIYY